MASPKAARANPLAFTPGSVTIIVTVVYVALLVPLIVVHHVLPSAPSKSPKGVNLTEAWADLQYLTAGFHPYNSHRNDDVHQWLLTRVNEILETRASEQEHQAVGEERPDVFVFDDNTSNLTFAGGSVASKTAIGVYFEGTNIIVYIRGSEDSRENWWEDPEGEPEGKGGVLVNAHYDSVSTGYGATDDGVGVISCLQLIRYFTTPGHAPRKGLVVLFNNGEEDFLNGARVYSQHPISKFPHTFLNLEGAGAGGRATLFRSSDTEVTRFYEKSEYPFGSVLSADGFQLGLVRSETDYIIFEGDLGLRGLDVAFMEPRARYHTDQDDTRYTSKDSVWHMLSTAIATTNGLVSDPSNRFDGEPEDRGKVPSGKGSSAVWFDLFGSTFAVFQLHTLFALSVTLLIVGPLTLFVTSVALSKVNRMYLFSISVPLEEDGDERIPLYGLRGVFRFIFLFGIPTGVAVGLAYLLTKINPQIVHSSEYSVWSMIISAWVFLAWFVSRVADFARPSALHRVYTLTWMFIVVWVLLVITTVYANKFGLAGGYFIFFYFVGVFLATWVSYLELFSLPRKSDYVGQFRQVSRRASSFGSRLLTPTADEIGSVANVEEESTETTSLLRGRRMTFAHYTRVDDDNNTISTHIAQEHDRDPAVYAHEQQWSAKLPKWTWALQLLLLAPVVIILTGQLGLFLTSALHQTGQDGSSVLTVYLLIVAFAVLLLSPILPFVHRYTYHIPVFLLLVFIGTLIYNLAAFPFSPTNRMKLFFIQEVDLDTGVNRASLTGIPPFVNDAVKAIPSVAGRNTTCDWLGPRLKCSWEGLPPRVVDVASSAYGGPENDWVSFNVSKTGRKRARFDVSGRNTRACKLLFDSPISDFSVAGAALDDRFRHIYHHGTKEIRLWSRTWGNTWTVDVQWPKGDMSGRVVCLWSDNNSPGLIPALDEIRHYIPNWVAITKLSDGLVEGSKSFTV